MNRQVLVRVVVSAAVLVGAVCLLFFLTMRDGAQPYKHVDEVMVNPSEWYGKPMQLHGFAENVEKATNSFSYRFVIRTGEYSVKATYTGSVPDTFKDGAELVIKGKLAEDGFHVAPDGVMAKCPSRYEGNQPNAAKAGK
jgi:cytochrome c-type biogenesis protein CcmE